jgi:hypothetical protein
MRIAILQVRTEIALTSVTDFLREVGLYSTRAHEVKDRTPPGRLMKRRSKPVLTKEGTGGPFLQQESARIERRYSPP